MKKKKLLITAVCIVVLLAIALVVFFFVLKKKDADSKAKIYVESVGALNGTTVSGYDRFVGVVESQETKDIQKEDNRTVKEVYVKVGDTVKEGDKLFSYDTEEMNLELKQLELELSSIYSNITSINQQISDLQAEKDQAPAENMMEYTSQIQSLQADIHQANYDASEKQLEIDRQKKLLENADVLAPMDGVVKEINDSPSSEDEYGLPSGSAYMKIMAVGSYRVKATVSEMTARNLSVDQPMIVRSRIDSSLSWKGTITKIDLDKPDNGNSAGDDYYEESYGETTKYPFYVSLENSSDLLLGEHVYLEFDYGQGDVKEGVWMYSFFIMQEEDGAYVWVEVDGKIKKRKVELGEYDQNLMMYNITSGLETTDYIAFPTSRVKEGMKTSHNVEDMDVSDEELGGAYEEYDSLDMEYPEGEFEATDLDAVDMQEYNEEVIDGEESSDKPDGAEDGSEGDE